MITFVVGEGGVGSGVEDRWRRGAGEAGDWSSSCGTGVPVGSSARSRPCLFLQSWRAGSVPSVTPCSQCSHSPHLPAPGPPSAPQTAFPVGSVISPRPMRLKASQTHFCLDVPQATILPILSSNCPHQPTEGLSPLPCLPAQPCFLLTHPLCPPGPHFPAKLHLSRMNVITASSLLPALVRANK